jgi:serine/threonine protein kinase
MRSCPLTEIVSRSQKLTSQWLKQNLVTIGMIVTMNTLFSASVHGLLIPILATPVALWPHLGDGSFGRVFKVVQQSSCTEFALKVSLSDPSVVTQSVLEARMMTQIHGKPPPEAESQHFLKIHRFFFEANRRVLPSHRSPGHGPFASCWESRRATALGGPIVQVVARQLLEGAKLLNRLGIIHGGDIKPENILIKEAETTTVKIADFGSARWVTYPCLKPVQVHWLCHCGIVSWLLPLFPGQNRIQMLQFQKQFIAEFPQEMIRRSPPKGSFLCRLGCKV